MQIELSETELANLVVALRFWVHEHEQADDMTALFNVLSDGDPDIKPLTVDEWKVLEARLVTATG
jgi:hypothetical protein